MNEKEMREFGRIRRILWPIQSHEQKMLIPMFLMLLFICFNYSVLRNMKDALVVTARSSGAAVIPFIKVWAMLPMAILVTVLYTKLAERYSQETVFYFIIGGFLFFFALFGLVLYPNQEYLHPHEFAQKLEEVLPGGFKWLVAMLRNWTFTGFYVLSELWGCIVLTVLFWSFANEVTRIGDAKRFYAVLSFGGNLAAVLAGQIPGIITRGNYASDSVNILLVMVVISGLATMGIFRWMNCNVLNAPQFDNLHRNVAEAQVKKGKKKKLSLRESFGHLTNSKYLLCIAALVVGYNLVINLVEVVWKDQLKQLYPGFDDYNAYLGNLTTGIGILSMVMAPAIPYLIQRFSWTGTALITPVTILTTGLFFFGLLFFKDILPAAGLPLIGASPLAMLVFIGAAQNCLSKGCKYSVFDTTKEMAFIPLDHSVKLKGKAAIDGVGSRLGKSGGSLLHQSLLLVFGGSLAASAPYVAAILLLVIVGWIMATKSLGRQLHVLVASHGEQIGEDREGELVAAATHEVSPEEEGQPTASGA